jgi:hypothetical protein
MSTSELMAWKRITLGIFGLKETRNKKEGGRFLRNIGYCLLSNVLEITCQKIVTASELQISKEEKF